MNLEVRPRNLNAWKKPKWNINNIVIFIINQKTIRSERRTTRAIETERTVEGFTDIAKLK